MVNIPSFSEIITSVSIELKEPVAVEGVPEDYAAVTEDATKIFQSQRGWKRLEQLASLLDYEVTRDRAGILLRKKYTSVQDVPCVSFDELYDFYKDMRALSRNYSPPFWEPRERGTVPPDMRGKHEFIRSLSSDEWEQMKTEGLAVSQLGGASTAILYKDLASSYIGGHYTLLDELLTTLDAIRHSTVEVRGETVIVSWTTPFGMPMKTILKKDSEASKNLPAIVTFPTYKEESLIKSVEETWNQRSGDKTVCDYAPGLREKPLLIVSGNPAHGAAATGILISKLYNLRVERRGGVYQVRPHRVPRYLNSVEDFRPALLTAFPSPLKRSILVPEQSQKRFGEWFSKATGSAVMGKLWRATEVCEGARNFVISNLSSRLKKEKNKTLAFSTALPREKAAIALWLSRDYLEWVASSLYLEPLYITHFRKLRLICKQYTGTKERPMLLMRAVIWDEKQNKWFTAISWGGVWDPTTPAAKL